MEGDNDSTHFMGLFFFFFFSYGTYFSSLNMSDFKFFFFKHAFRVPFNTYLMGVHCVLDTVRVQDECTVPFGSKKHFIKWQKKMCFQ